MSGGEEDAWTPHYARRAEKDISQLDRQVRRRVLLAIGRLIADPDHAAGVRKLTGRPEARLRVGDWRVIFEAEPESHTVIVHRVLPRGRAYDR
ncbi:MAG TPA: type II toxin-antitoxin system RelE/ParE family toxin [Solirubrobacteraceae bacterium]|jgi:mRNA-degrading endonuclease RelE of RelBE toxin-antitoxin system